MKIRLTVSAPKNGPSRTVECVGSTVRIGRDPDFEVCLQGPEADLCSTRHARIDLSPDGAILTDTGSTNHTLHNDQEVVAPTRLKPGDRIQIGYTGSTLTVLSLDLAPPRVPPIHPAANRAKTQRAVLLGGGAIAAGLLLGVVLLLVAKRGKANDPQAEAEQPKTQVVKTAATETKPTETKPTETKPTETEPVIKPIRTGPEPIKVSAPPEVIAQKVGNYIRPENGAVSVLVGRESDNQPWVAARSGEPIYTARTLVSLPGYQSHVFLDKGVNLNLWGNLEEIWPMLQARECMVMLNAPAEGFNADLILERGRVELECREGVSKAVVRVRMGREVWDVTLSEKGSKAVVDYWYNVADNGTGPAIGVHSQGKVTVKTPREEVHRDKNSLVAWAGWAPNGLYKEYLRELPPWWKGDAKPEKRALIAAWFLKDWAGHIDKATGDVVTVIKERVIDKANNPEERRQGLWFLSALDEAPLLVELGLNDQDPGIRTVATNGLQECLRRNETGRNALLRELKALRTSDETANILLKLLVPLPTEELEKPTTYQDLIRWLDYADMRIRHLASCHLYVNLRKRGRIPDAAAEIPYEPTMSAEARKQAIDKWQKVVPEGTVPRGKR